MSYIFLRFPSLPVLLLLACSGCAEHRPPDELARAVNMGERPVAMKGEGVFFGKKLGVTVTVSRGIGRGGAGANQNSAKARRKNEMADLSGMDNDEAIAYIRAKSAVGSPMPPVTLHLRLENLTAAPFSVDLLDFDSDLGNFAVHPGTITVNPAQITEPDPMISQLGVTSDEIPVKVTVRLGTQKETQTILVKSFPTVGAPAGS